MSESHLFRARGWVSSGWQRFVQLFGAVWADRTLRSIFLGFLLIDLAWTIWYGVAVGLHEAGITDSWEELVKFHITEEGGYPEYYNYTKTMVLVLLLGRLALSTRQWVYLAYTIVYAVILMDDFLTIHETVGGYLRRTLEIKPILNLRNQDIGEVITWTLMGTLIVPLMIYGFARSDRSHVRNGLALLYPFGMLLFCAIVVDQLYNPFHAIFFGSGILIDMVEDGGEMVAITWTLALAAVLVKYEPGG